MDNVITLTKPLENGSQTIFELEFAEPTAKEMMHLGPEATFKDLLKIAAMLTNQPERLLQKLCVRDARKVVDHTAFLLTDGLSS